MPVLDCSGGMKLLVDIGSSSKSSAVKLLMFTDSGILGGVKLSVNSAGHFEKLAREE